MLNLSYANFAKAWRHYAELDQGSLLDALGWTEAGVAELRNGAVRTSLALLACGIPIRGSLRIEAGPLAGGKVYNGADRLADWLATHYTPPETLTLEHGLTAVADQLFARRGIVAFTQGSGPRGGLIGLLDGRCADQICATAAGKHPLDVRFWPLP